MPSNTVRDFKNVMVRMGTEFVEDLDKLCATNRRTRREVLEILIDEAMEELTTNPDARLNYVTPAEEKAAV